MASYKSKNYFLIKHFCFWLAAVIAVVLDQASKFWVIQALKSKSWAVWPNVLHFTYAENRGAAFSWFDGHIDVLKWVSLVVSLALICLGLFTKKLPRWEQWGYGLILGGAMGNGIDRFFRGYVVDFIDVQFVRFANFNIADSFITIGLICLAISIWQLHQESA
ncbi:MAG: signal peptidase II [Pseudanabaena sp. ELA607]|jgi:signal peptidase II